jgi:hypothetical protein
VPGSAAETAAAGYRPLLFSIAYGMTGSVGDAEDIVQDAFLGIPLGGDVHRVPPGIDVGSGFGKLAQSQGYRQLLGPLLRRLNQRQQLLLPERIGTRRDVRGGPLVQFMPEPGSFRPGLDDLLVASGRQVPVEVRLAQALLDGLGDELVRLGHEYGRAAVQDPVARVPEGRHPFLGFSPYTQAPHTPHFIL